MKTLVVVSHRTPDANKSGLGSTANHIRINGGQRLAVIGAGFLVLAMPSTPLPAAQEPRLPPGITCRVVREKVAEHGKLVAYTWAKLNGYSRKEIAEARKCLTSQSSGLRYPVSDPSSFRSQALTTCQPACSIEQSDAQNPKHTFGNHLTT